jgi:diguanylate cyclase (GGDEF)-like protein
VGDLLLIEVARRLKASVREVDTVARQGGDEFVVILSELDETLETSQTKAMTIADKIRHSLAEVYLLGDAKVGTASRPIEHHCSASVGVEVFDPSQTDQEVILRHADAAMYRAKETGRNQVVLYTTLPATQ